MDRPAMWLVPGAAALLLSVAPLAEAEPPEQLLGEPFTAALARFGPPSDGVGSDSLLRFCWRDADAGSLTLSVHCGTVVGVDTRHLRAPLLAKELPRDGIHTGQPIADVVRRLGNPDRVLADRRGNGTTLVFGTRHVRAVGGFVVDADGDGRACVGRLLRLR